MIFMDLLDKLNHEQRKAAMHTEGPLLLIAGAGSGKTRVITHRIANLIEKGVSPFNILAITFTNKAAKEMKQRVNELSPRGNEVWVSTFHSMCVRILRSHINNLGYENSFTIYDSDDSESVMKSVVKELNLYDKMYQPKSVLGIVGRYKDQLKTPLDIKKEAETDFRLENYAMIYETYQKKLKNNNALDFDDIIFKTVDLFKSKPEILEKYQDRFHYIMVDEYQDSATRCAMKSCAA